MLKFIFQIALQNKYANKVLKCESKVLAWHASIFPSGQP